MSTLPTWDEVESRVRAADDKIEKLENGLRILGNVVSEQIQQIASLYALLEKLTSERSEA